MKTKVTGSGFLRVSLAGGGTDIPEFYQQHEPGEVVAIALNREVHVSIGKSDNRPTECYPDPELKHNGTDASEPMRSYLRRILEACIGIGLGRHIVFADHSIPFGTGLGVSSAFAVAGMKCVMQFEHSTIRYANKDVIEASHDFETVTMKNEGIGYQDHYMAELGGVKHLKFYKDRVEVSEIPCSHEAIADHLTLIYLGRRKETAGERLRGKLDLKSLERSLSYVEIVRQSLVEGDFETIGIALRMLTRLKMEAGHEPPGGFKELLDEMTAAELVWGGKFCGAGGGGFALLCHSFKKRDRLREAVRARGLEPFTVRVGTHKEKADG